MKKLNSDLQSLPTSEQHQHSNIDIIKDVEGRVNIADDLEELKLTKVKLTVIAC